MHQLKLTQNSTKGQINTLNFYHTLQNLYKFIAHSKHIQYMYIVHIHYTCIKVAIVQKNKKYRRKKQI